MTRHEMEILRRRRYGSGKPYISGNKIYFGGRVRRGKDIFGTALKTVAQPLAQLLLGV